MISNLTFGAVSRYQTTNMSRAAAMADQLYDASDRYTFVHTREALIPTPQGDRFGYELLAISDAESDELLSKLGISVQSGDSKDDITRKLIHQLEERYGKDISAVSYGHERAVNGYYAYHLSTGGDVIDLGTDLG